MLFSLVQTKHTKQDVGKLYTMPEDVRRQLFDKYVLPLYFERLIDVFNETNIVVREPALELIEYLKRANYDKPVIRYVLCILLNATISINFNFLLVWSFGLIVFNLDT